VVAKGDQIGLTATDTARHFGEMMHSTLEKARIELDHYGWPQQSPTHIARTQEVFRRLFDAGWLVEREAPSLHCDRCDRYLFEVWVSGRCPHCGSGTNGNACEDCGRPNDCADLIAPRCKRCGDTPSTRQTRRIYFRLSAFADLLRAHVDSAEMNVHLRALCERMFADGLPDIAASHVTDWGVEVPIPGFERQRIYVWFEMAAGYLAATEDLGDPDFFDRSWRGGGEAVQFFGFDNGYFHALLFPAIFFAFDRRLQPPKTFVMNEFYRLDGSKFSTSRNHAIWGQQILGRFTADVIRFYLAFDGPEREQSSFNLGRFEQTISEELGGR
jgi:methionyl-tRNA synthetase